MLCLRFGQNSINFGKSDRSGIIIDMDMIEPEAARDILDEALTPYLDEEWRLLENDDYTALLNRGGRNLRIRVDLVGEVHVEEMALTPAQTNGRLVAWVLLIAAFLVVLALASALGLLP